MKSIIGTLSQGAGSFAVKATIVVTAALGGAGMVASNVFAALTATATNTSGGSVTTGTLKLEYAASGSSGAFATAISALAPGDTVNRYIDLNISGTLDGETPTLQLATSDSNTLVNDGIKGLQVSVLACSVAWTQTGFGTCSGSVTVALNQTSVATLKSAAQNLVLPTTLAGTTNRLKLIISLPTTNENVINGVLPVGTVQGLTAALTWSFVIQERTAITSNS
jgi:hypothetical protein